MAETVAGTYATLAGIEIVNDIRTYSYLKNGLGPSTLNVYGECGCTNLIELLDCPGVTGYVDPASDEAPWYSTTIPESADFLGFITNEFEGMSSPFTRNVEETIRNGSVLSRSRLGTRELKWSGFLFGSSCCGVQYGLRWLSKVLSGFGTTCKDCFGDDLELLTCCPETGGSNPFRLLKGVGLLEGPVIISQRATCDKGCSSGCGASCIIEIEFTLAASQPYFYAAPVPLYDCVNIWDNAVDPYTPYIPYNDLYGFDAECGTENCGQLLLDSGLCPSPELPPQSNYSSACFNFPNPDPQFADPKAAYLSVSRMDWNSLEEVVPVISVTTGGTSVSNLRIGFYSSMSDNPCGDLSNFPTSCDVLCDKINIIGIPANSTLYIDGRTRKMSVICSDGNVFPGERLTVAPWSWPSFDCYGFCMEVLFDTYDYEYPGYMDTCVSLSLVPRTF